MTTLSAAGPPVRVVVVSSGPGWLVTAVAVLGVVLALASLAWQVVTFRWSGSRVRVETRLALFPEIAGGAPVFPDQERLGELDPSVQRDLVPVAVIRNAGRLPVTVQQCAWSTEHVSTDISELRPGGVLPWRLEAHGACYATLGEKQLAMLAELARKMALAGPSGEGRQEVWPVVELGNGKIVAGRPVRLPLADRDGG